MAPIQSHIKQSHLFEQVLKSYSAIL